MYEYNPYKYRKSALKINMDDKISKKKKDRNVLLPKLVNLD